MKSWRLRYAFSASVAASVWAAVNVTVANFADTFPFSSATAISTVTIAMTDDRTLDAIDTYTTNAPEPATRARMLAGFAGLSVSSWRASSGVAPKRSSWPREVCWLSSFDDRTG
jgi:hypothetical protein